MNKIKSTKKHNIRSNGFPTYQFHDYYNKPQIPKLRLFTICVCLDWPVIIHSIYAECHTIVSTDYQ